MRRRREVLVRAARTGLALAGAWIALCLVFGVVIFAIGALLEGPLDGTDRALLAVVGSLRAESLMAPLRQVSWLGRPEVTVPLAWVGAAVLLAVGERRGAVQTLVTYLGAGSAYLALAPVFQRPRPRLSGDAPLAEGWALPSGHVIGALAALLPIAIAVARRWPKAGLAAGAAALFYTGVVAGTRLVLQVHYLSDVLAAVLITGLWYVVSDALIERGWDQRRRVEVAGVTGTTSTACTSARARGAPAEDVAESCPGDAGSAGRA